jgi:deoxyribodipyrimidine photolyase
MTSDAPSILWFRNDRRLADHAALQAAIETGSGPRALGGASRGWLHHSFAPLQQSLACLGANLTLGRGDSVAIISDTAEQAGTSETFTGGSADPWVRRGAWPAAEATGIGHERANSPKKSCERANSHQKWSWRANSRDSARADPLSGWFEAPTYLHRMR